MSDQRVGLGFDVHAYSDDDSRILVLGGVTFPNERGLRGHSDADVVAHAIADGVLGACGLGDLGEHFPDDDDAWLGASSIGLLSRCVELAAEAGYRVVNVDCTVVCERPKLAARREEMASRLAEALGGPVNVKGTSPEGLGALGRVEGVACLSVVLLER